MEAADQSYLDYPPVAPLKPTGSSTERCGTVVTHWTRIREDPGLTPGPAILISIFHGFLNHSRRMMGWVRNKGHGRFLPIPSPIPLPCDVDETQLSTLGKCPVPAGDRRAACCGSWMFGHFRAHERRRRLSRQSRAPEYCYEDFVWRLVAPDVEQARWNREYSPFVGITRGGEEYVSWSQPFIIPALKHADRSTESEADCGTRSKRQRHSTQALTVSARSDRDLASEGEETAKRDTFTRSVAQLDEVRQHGLEAGVVVTPNLGMAPLERVLQTAIQQKKESKKYSEQLLTASRILRADEGEASGGMQGLGKREVPEKICNPEALSGTIPEYENPDSEPAGNRTKFVLRGTSALAL
ncbi:hypothetical protein PR048_002760 [Dryococelus australis]|uniref:Uncharacterized protein n=1 Tax=Dryococelus australis TaxID=614101 RepID=A0ABQ9IMJ9_9NEOP|nr:hypothetical protein PR048_002760 [Dryococelus australis]